MNRTISTALAMLASIAFVTASAATPSPTSANLQFAADRAEIEDLQARYMFALDWQDADAYAATFTEDGVLDWAYGVVRGREAIRTEVRGMREGFAKKEAADPLHRPARLRHFVTNVVIKIDGDSATEVSYWFEANNEVSGRFPFVTGYGHYEDTLKRVNGKWLFKSRKIFNEAMADRVAGSANPGAR